MTYEESLDWLSGLQGRGWRLGLDRMRAFVRAAGLEDVLGGPGSPIRYLHVAGTNGKGSVTAYLQSMLVAQGYRTGGYFSPYVVDPRERIQIDGELIAKDEFAAVATELREVAERFDQTEEGGVTEFEVKTAMGFLAWKRAGVEVVALEVGLGGRLDATNVVTPAACAIVSISLDHTKILGETEAEIAREKGGILKPSVPAVIGIMSQEASQAILEVGREVGAPVRRLGPPGSPVADVFLRSDDGIGVRVDTGRSQVVLVAGIDGMIQGFNAALAYAVIEAGGFLRDQEAAIRALAETRLVGRSQWIALRGKQVFVDGAHNSGSSSKLAMHLLALSEGRMDSEWTAIVGMVDGHNPKEFFDFGMKSPGLMKQVVGRVLTVPIDNPRALSPATVAEAAASAGFEAEAFDSIESALADAGSGPIVLTGSFYLVGEAMRLADNP